MYRKEDQNLSELDLYYKIFPDSSLCNEDGSLLSVFHGTNSQFTSFRKAGFKKNQQLGFGIHFSEDKDFAELYAKGKNGRVLECVLDIRNPLDVRGLIHKDTQAFEFARALYKKSSRAHQWPMMSDHGYTYLNLDLFDQKRVVRMMQEAGFDGVIYKAEYGSRSVQGMSFGINKTAESKSYVVLEPEQVQIIGPNFKNNIISQEENSDSEDYHPSGMSF